jgi:hypothetical protein
VKRARRPADAGKQAAHHPTRSQPPPNENKTAARTNERRKKKIPQLGTVTHSALNPAGIDAAQDQSPMTVVGYVRNPPTKQTRPSDTRDNIKRGSREPIWVGIVELKPGMCRYLRDGDGGVEFCGAATRSLSLSWCPAHKLICCATDARTRA